MKNWFLLLLLAGSFTSKAQNLKDLLFSGKLKSDSNTVVKKTDDLNTKIDTVQKKAETASKSITGIGKVDSMGKAGAETTTANPNTENHVAETVTAAVSEPPAATTVVKTPNKIWKEYTDSLVNSIRSEVLGNKKVKKDTYYVTVDYEADGEGAITVNNVTVLPENAYLQDQLKQRLALAPPQLNPAPDGNKAKKLKRKYNFSIVKE